RARRGWRARQRMNGHSQKQEKQTPSQVITMVQERPDQISSAVFVPNKQELDVTLTNGKKVVVHYAGDQSQANLQNELQKSKVTFDSKGVGSSPWWSILTSLLPFVLLFGFWIFLMNQVQGGGSKVMSF